MSIRKLLLETGCILFLITFSVITINSLQIRHNASTHFDKLQEEYFEATYEIYKDEIIGNLLLGDPSIEEALYSEIANRRNIDIMVSNPDDESAITSKFSEKPVKVYDINLGEGKHRALAMYPKNEIKHPWLIDELLAPLVLEALLFSIGFAYLWRRFTKCVLFPLADLVAHLKPGQIETYSPQANSIYELKELSETLKLMNIEIQSQSEYKAEVNTAKQVGHDIRSPLACLVLLLSQASGLPENQRKLMRSAIQRITDIANSLHRKALSTNHDLSVEKIENCMISSLVDSLITEKRVHLREKGNVDIHFNMENAYGLFSNVNSAELKRVLSNIINNSVESFDDKPHLITICVERVNDWVQIQVSDDGKGIPKDIIGKIGQPGFSYGKEYIANSGTGLGISYAMKVLRSFGGNFLIDSVLHQGTTITIKLPRSNIPDWCIEEIRLEKGHQIIILDDDQSIHNLWNDRLKIFNEKGVKIKNFSCAEQFREYQNEIVDLDVKNILYLIDFELNKQNHSGIDLIEEFEIIKNSVLVTSYYDDPNIMARADKLGIRMIPKGIAAFVPITCANFNDLY